MPVSAVDLRSANPSALRLKEGLSSKSSLCGVDVDATLFLTEVHVWLYSTIVFSLLAPTCAGGVALPLASCCH